MDLTVIGKEAKAASRILGRLNVEEKNKGLKAAGRMRLRLRIILKKFLPPIKKILKMLKIIT